jgi:hypothetical protein
VAYIQLKDLKQMYERWTVGDQALGIPLTTAQIVEGDTSPPFQYGAPESASTTYILFVHGWNMTPYDKDRFAERAFKRLYWQGYLGRFAAFRWPTNYNFTGNFWDIVFSSRHYDNSERAAWRSAQGLLNKLNDLNQSYPGHVYLLAHSMGNVVAGEALRLASVGSTGALVNTYVASQAAIPAHVYDATVSNPWLLEFNYHYPDPPFYGEYGPQTPNIYGDRLAGNIAAVGRRVNYYNVNDFALVMPRWGFDQVTKPDVGYAYGPVGHFQRLGGPEPYSLDLNNLEELYEAMAYVAESRSTALGATPVDLEAKLDLSADNQNAATRVWPPDPNPLGLPYSDHFWHSAQFRGDNVQEQGYWRALLFRSGKGFEVGVGSP